MIVAHFIYFYKYIPSYTYYERGYTVLHVAAQYGHTSFIHRLVMRWNAADFDKRDNDGRTPLHWASYKGTQSDELCLKCKLVENVVL